MVLIQLARPTWFAPLNWNVPEAALTTIRAKAFSFLKTAAEQVEVAREQRMVGALAGRELKLLPQPVHSQPARLRHPR